MSMSATSLLMTQHHCVAMLTCVTSLPRMQFRVLLQQHRNLNQRARSSEYSARRYIAELRVWGGMADTAVMAEAAAPLAAPAVVELEGSRKTQGAADDQAKYGFNRPEMYKDPLVGTVALYERHVFLCYNDAQSWPPQVEAAEFDGLPQSLFAAVKARKNDMPKKTRVTVCEGLDGTDCSNGDILIFPDLLLYRGVAHSDVDLFVEEVLVKERDWMHGRREQLTGNHVFVCAHAQRDARCGTCGPALISKFKEEIANCGLNTQVTVRACSHIGGHKFAGNVIIYGAVGGSPVTGHWYGYVKPEDVTILLDEHIRKGHIVEKLWRGQMCLSEEEQKQLQQSRQVENEHCCACGFSQQECGRKDAVEGKGDSKISPKIETVSEQKQLEDVKTVVSKEQGSWCKASNWPRAWEKGDTLAAAVVVIGAAASITLAYYMCRRNS